MEGVPLILSMEGTLYERGIFSAKNGNNHLHGFAMLLEQWRKKGQKISGLNGTQTQTSAMQVQCSTS